MPNRVQIVRHIAAAAAAFLGREGELTADLDNENLRLHNNVDDGGAVIPNETAVDAKDAAVTAAAVVREAAVADDAVQKSVMTAANEVIVSTGADTEGVVAMAASRMLARLAAGNVVAATPAEIRTLLSLVIGTNVQAFDAGLLSIAALTTAADKMIYTTASDVYAVAALTAFGRSLIDDADAATARATLSVYSQAQVDAIVAAVSEVPIGAAIPFTGTSAPTGFLLGLGQEVSQVTYADLYALYGADLYGIDAGGNFFIPDLRGRVPIGAGTGDAADATEHLLADKEGTETHVLLDAEMPSDFAKVGVSSFTDPGGAGILPAIDGGGSDTAHNNTQPSLTLNFIIKT